MTELLIQIFTTPDGWATAIATGVAVYVICHGVAAILIDPESCRLTEEEIQAGRS